MAEIRDCPGWLGYRVGDDGLTWSLWTPRHPVMTDTLRPLTPSVSRKGYLRVALNRRLLDGRRGMVSRFVHQLVLEAFVGPCPPGMEACHDPDPDPLNNHVGNLRWDTHKSNMNDVAKHERWPDRRGESHPRSKLKEPTVREVFRLDSVGVGYRQISELLSLPRSTVGGILYGETWAHLRLKRTGRSRYRDPSSNRCVHGHEMTPENNYVHTNGSTHCRACGRESKRRQRGTHAASS